MRKWTSSSLARGKSFRLASRVSRLRHAILSVVPCLIGMALSLGACAIYDPLSQSKPFRTTSSPGGVYTVVLSGRSDRPKVPIVDHKVLMDVVKSGKPFLSGKELYSGDSLDASFDEWFPEYQWVTEKSLQFYKDQFRRDLPNDTITLENNSSRRISFLKIMSVDMLIIFDLEPRSTATFVVSRARSDLKWTSVEGEFDGGQAIVGSSRDLDVSKRMRPVFFRITIGDTRTTIADS